MRKKSFIIPKINHKASFQRRTWKYQMIFPRFLDSKPYFFSNLEPVPVTLLLFDTLVLFVRQNEEPSPVLFVPVTLVSLFFLYFLPGRLKNRPHALGALIGSLKGCRSSSPGLSLLLLRGSSKALVPVPKRFGRCSGFPDDKLGWHIKIDDFLVAADDLVQPSHCELPHMEFRNTAAGEIRRSQLTERRIIKPDDRDILRYTDIRGRESPYGTGGYHVVGSEKGGRQ